MISLRFNRDITPNVLTSNKIDPVVVWLISTDHAANLSLDCPTSYDVSWTKMKPFPLCRLRNRRAFKDLRARLVGKRSLCAESAGVGPATLSRLERGVAVEKRSALIIFDYLVRIAVDKGEDIQTFDLWFQELSAEVYDWDQVSRGAEVVGKKIFHRFHADAVLTFPGPSAIFTNLVMAKALSPEEYLRKSVHTAWFENKGNQSQAKTLSNRNFSSADRGAWKILIPRALDGSDKRMRRVAIIDDHIITGMTLDCLRQHLVQKHHYSADRIMGACCVLGSHPILPLRGQDVWAFVAEKEDFSLPWGLEAASFEAQIRRLRWNLRDR